MKTIKTSAGLRKIEAQSNSSLTEQIKKILYDHRAQLIGSLIDVSGNLHAYLNYRFDLKFSQVQLKLIRSRLIDLRETSISEQCYAAVIDAVQTLDFMILNNEYFYTEINETIKTCYSQNELFKSALSPANEGF